MAFLDDQINVCQLMKLNIPYSLPKKTILVLIGKLGKHASIFEVFGSPSSDGRYLAPSCNSLSPLSRIPNVRIKGLQLISPLLRGLGWVWSRRKGAPGDPLVCEDKGMLYRGDSDVPFQGIMASMHGFGARGSEKLVQ